MDGPTPNEAFEAPSGEGPRIDLHLHSTASDGRLDPAGVMAAAKERGLAAAALTDHDTLAGLPEALHAALELELEFVPGIELSTYDEAGSTHLLGYFVDPQAEDFSTYLDWARGRRVERARAIVEKLNGLGIGLAMEDVDAQVGANGLIARPHIARAMLEAGWVKSYREAFDRFIAAGQPAYVPTGHTTPAQGIEQIHGAGGAAVLAHPGGSHDEERIRGLRDAGLDGLEVLHPEHGPEEVRRLRRLAAELGMLETGGSDWHGPMNGRHGRLASQPVPYDWYVRLREFAER